MNDSEWDELDYFFASVQDKINQAKLELIGQRDDAISHRYMDMHSASRGDK